MNSQLRRYSKYLSAVNDGKAEHIYSVVLYIILRKYICDLQKKYRVLLEAINQIAEGNLNVTISEEIP